MLPRGGDAVRLRVGMAIREFSDYQSVSGYARRAMGWAVNAGLLRGGGNRLMPRDAATRAQIAALLHRWCASVKK